MKKLIGVATYTPGASSETLGRVELPWPCAGIHGTTTTVSPLTTAPEASVIVSSAASRPTTGASGEKRTAVPSAPEAEATESAGDPENTGGGPSALLESPPHPSAQRHADAQAVASTTAERLPSLLTNGGPTGAPAC